MAMKINKTAITRLEVTMSCGCLMYSDFTDSQCKNALVLMKDETPERVFHACETHHKDAGLSLLKFIIGERIDEATIEAQKAPVVPEHQYSAPVDIQSTLLSGATVQSVAQVKPEVRQRARPEDPTKVKVLNRGGGVVTQDKTAIEMGMEAEEDENISDSVENVLSNLADLERDDSKLFL